MKKSSMGLFGLSAAVIAASVLAGAGLAYISGPAETISDDGPPYSSVAVIQSGRIPGTGDAAEPADEDVFRYIVNTTVTFDTSTAVGNIMLENTPGNSCLIGMEIVLTDTGETVYYSPTLEPNSCYLSDRLTYRLEAGTYKAKACITAYDRDTGEEIGHETTNITLTVNG